MTRSPLLQSNPFVAVAEQDAFLALFPHRFDFIFAEHPAPGESPDWQTERRYPLSDRLLQQGRYLYGVRFGATTCYCLLDIDAASAYHPQQDALAISRLLAALEPLNLVAPICCTSSLSGGLHLYFPFEQAHSSWQIAAAVATLLEHAGFRLLPGQLEIFPNPKPYIVDGAPNLYNGHRLPMQAGSYLLNADFQPVWSDRLTFTQQWRFAQARNDLDHGALRRVLRQMRQTRYRISGKADKFISDLNAEIEAGWTDFGQTNYLLGRITMRCYIFHHVLEGGEPLAGRALAEEIAATARSLPGYQQWCRHQHEIEQKAAEWARCIENSHYFPYGTALGKYKQKQDAADAPSWNQQQTEAARERIRAAIADLLAQNALPSGITARFQALTHYGIGGSSLYRHRDLWHPGHLWQSPPDPPDVIQDEREDSAEGASSRHSPTSLLSSTDRNVLQDEQFGDRDRVALPKTGRNLLLQGDATDSVPTLYPSFPCHVAPPPLFLAVPLPETVHLLRWYDLSDLLAAVAVELRRLAWSADQMRDRLISCFQKANPALLEDWEVAQWLIWLRQQTTPT